ncbi:conserved hypothetical protein [Staphylococcus aureus]|jgi:hypothetical protein|nr:hypothetical protein USA300HOU_2142 [Staphylococcus aureus subsp. aureus USA300_TCH1516]EES93980.1 hypothetical protein HMPREF0776_1394 [Staphylococcus aureus subsp. aureus USA300_TCH959]EFU26459.1 hypothetical protein CGSSa01_10104 [Staphylococcus aureus subsp. aureus CGS01]CRI09953.1 conserved hypothetical protein [Staphylococcus aureus]CRI20040.1 conserved hypothetical protein [Staphylococcus aureus]
MTFKTRVIKKTKQDNVGKQTMNANVYKINIILDLVL